MNREDYFNNLSRIRKIDGSELTEEEKEKLWEFNFEIQKEYGGKVKVTLDDILNLKQKP